MCRVPSAAAVPTKVSVKEVPADRLLIKIAGLSSVMLASWFSTENKIMLSAVTLASGTTTETIGPEGMVMAARRE